MTVLERCDAMQFDTESMERLIANNPVLYNAVNEIPYYDHGYDDNVKNAVMDVLDATTSIEHSHINLDMVFWYDVAHNFINPSEKDEKLYIKQRMNEISDIRKAAYDNPIFTLLGTILTTILILTPFIGFVSILISIFVGIIVAMWSDKLTILRGMDERIIECIRNRDTPEVCIPSNDPTPTDRCTTDDYELTDHDRDMNEREISKCGYVIVNRR